MSLAAVRDLRESRVPATAEELADVETDVLTGFVLARAAAVMEGPKPVLDVVAAAASVTSSPVGRTGSTQVLTRSGTVARARSSDQKTASTSCSNSSAQMSTTLRSSSRARSRQRRPAPMSRQQLQLHSALPERELQEPSSVIGSASMSHQPVPPIEHRHPAAGRNRAAGGSGVYQGTAAAARAAADRPSSRRVWSPGGDPRHPDFRYGRTVLLVQLVDVRPRGLDMVRQKWDWGFGPGRLGGADRGNKQRWRY